jgi:cysteine-rich repeat protein
MGVKRLGAKRKNKIKKYNNERIFFISLIILMIIIVLVSVVSFIFGDFFVIFSNLERVFERGFGERVLLSGPLENGLVGYWSFNVDGGEVVFDDSENGMKGRVMGGIYVSEGKNGGAYSFDGVDDYIGLGNSEQLRMQDEFTYSLWAKPIQQNKHLELIGWSSPNGASFEIWISRYSGKLALDRQGFSNIGYSNKGVVFSEWNHLAVSYNRQSGKYSFYINGVEAGSGVKTTGIGTGNPEMYFGKRNTGNYFNGIMDEIMIFNRVLSGEEVSSLYRGDYLIEESGGDIEEEKCIENWICKSFSECINGKQNRICEDSNNCGTFENKPLESQTCTINQLCTENWTCENWGECINGKQVRKCIDKMSCNTKLNKPAEEKECYVEEEEIKDKDNDEVEDGGEGGGAGIDEDKLNRDLDEDIVDEEEEEIIIRDVICEIISVKWTDISDSEIEEAESGQNVRMRVETDGCEGKEATFTVIEDDGLFGEEILGEIKGRVNNGIVSGEVIVKGGACDRGSIFGACIFGDDRDFVYRVSINPTSESGVLEVSGGENAGVREVSGSNSCENLPNLLAYFNFRAGSLNDVTTNNNNVLCNEEKCPSVIKDRNGELNSAMDFDGIDDLLKTEIGTNLGGMNELTVSTWFNSRNLDLPSTIIEKFDGSYILKINAGKLFGSIRNENGEEASVEVDIPVTVQSPSGLLQPEDFIYKGAFRLPPSGKNSRGVVYLREGGAGSGLSIGPDGTIYSRTYSRDRGVMRFSVPEPIISYNLEELNSATLVDGPISDLIPISTIGEPTGNPAGAGAGVLKAVYYDEILNKLFLAGHRYYVSSANENRPPWWSRDSVLLTPSPDASTIFMLWKESLITWPGYNGNNPDVDGDWKTWHANKFNAYACKIAQRYQEEIGRIIAGGLEVGDTSNYLGASGPTLFSWTPDPTKEAIESKLLIRFDKNKPWTKDDDTGGCFWYEDTQKESVVLARRLGTFENDCYGIPGEGECINQVNTCSINKGYHADPHKGELWFYNPEDLVGAARGQIDPYIIEPYAKMDLTEYFFKKQANRDGCSQSPSGMTIDRELNPPRVYITQSSVNDDSGGESVVHVFEIIESVSNLHHVALVYDGLNLKLYLDNILVSTVDASNIGEIRNDIEPLFIGCNPDSTGECIGEYFDGDLDEVMIFDKALNVEEIESVYNDNLCMIIPVCGDGVIDDGEGCDDNQNPPFSGDGCSNVCQIEQGYDCVSEPSICSECIDLDLDGYSINGGACGAIDCNDAENEVNPGAIEICLDGIDNDCLSGIDDGCPADSDSDGIDDENDNCINVANFEQEDIDNDLVGDACDNCVNIANSDQKNIDGDLLGDACDDDIDGDGILNEVDNCPLVSNSGQEDGDFDGIGDACEFCSINDNALVLHLAFNSGSLLDESTFANIVSCTNCPLNVEDKDGNINSALQFDSVDDYINVASSNSINNLDKFTFGAWIYPTSTGDREIISKAGSGKELRLKGSSGSIQLRGCVDVSNGDACSDSIASAIISNQWQHVAMTYDNTGDRKTHLYINGIEVSYSVQNVGVGTITTDSNSDLNIGRRTTASRYFGGNIDEVVIFNRVLEINEILDLSDGSVCGIEELVCSDSDSDGYFIEGGACGAIDCNDLDSEINPGANEICGDGIDNDCSGGDAVCIELTSCGAYPWPEEQETVIILVSTVAELQDAVSNAQSGEIISVNDGTYLITSQLKFSNSDITLRSSSGNRDAVIIDSNYGVGEMIVIDKPGISIIDLTVTRANNHPIKITNDGRNSLMYNVHVQDARQQFVKINANVAGGIFPDNGEIACSYFDLTDSGRANVDKGTTDCYTGAIDAKVVEGWWIHDNLFKDIYCTEPGQSPPAEHAVHFWVSSKDTITERNIIINNARGIGYGLGSSDGTRTYPGDPLFGSGLIQSEVSHIGGIIRNNFIYSDIGDLFDTGIGLESAWGVDIYHNTIYTADNVIEKLNELSLRGPTTKDNNIVNNLLTNKVEYRRFGTGIFATEVDQERVEANVVAEASMFVDVTTGELHLVDNALNRAKVIDKGVEVGVTDDIDLGVRPFGAGYEVGADEFESAFGGGNCIIDLDCDDGLSCTTDSCSGGVCSNLPSLECNCAAVDADSDGVYDVNDLVYLISNGVDVDENLVFNILDLIFVAAKQGVCKI